MTEGQLFSGSVNVLVDKDQSNHLPQLLFLEREGTPLSELQEKREREEAAKGLKCLNLFLLLPPPPPALWLRAKELRPT